MDRETFAERLRRLREERAMSLAQLAKHTGITVQGLWCLERDQQLHRSHLPKAKTMAVLAEALGDGSMAIWDGVVWP